MGHYTKFERRLSYMNASTLDIMTTKKVFSSVIAVVVHTKRFTNGRTTIQLSVDHQFSLCYGRRDTVPLILLYM